MPDNNSSNYKNLRYFLFTESFVAEQIAKKIREKHNIPENLTRDQWQRKLLDNYSHLYIAKAREWESKLKRKVDIDYTFLWVAQEYIEQQALPEISLVSKNLGFDEFYLRLFVLYKTVPKKLDISNYKYVTPLTPLTEEGMYIKITPEMTYNELEQEFKKARRSLEFHKNLIADKENKARVRKDIAKDDFPIKAKLYMFIEEEIKKIYEEKLELKKLRKSNNPYDYQEQLVGPAIERVAGNLISWDKEFLQASDEKLMAAEEQMKKRIRTIYYAIAKRYQLPTPKKLSSILGLISC